MLNNSDQTFFIQIIIWTTANGISMIAVWTLLIAILRSPKVRSSAFNLYLVFCLIPDAYKNTSGFFANLLNMLMTDGSPNACKVIGWNDVYWWTANLWMAFAVFLQLHRMLQANVRAQRYDPPKLKRVILESTAIHIFSILMATLTVVPADFIPKATAASGCEAFPGMGNMKQNYFYWAFFMPVTTLIPTFLVTLLCIHICWKGLLPVNGKSRSLLFYFARLLAVIYIVAIAVVVSFFFQHNWAQAIAFAVFNLVGLFQVCLALFKKDVRKAFVQFVTCNQPDDAFDPSRHQNDNIDSTPGDRRPTFTFFQSRRSLFRSSGRSRQGSLFGTFVVPLPKHREERDLGTSKVRGSDGTGQTNDAKQELDLEKGLSTRKIQFEDEDVLANARAKDGKKGNDIPTEKKAQGIQVV
jgi:hypothetical protein